MSRIRQLAGRLLEDQRGMTLAEEALFLVPITVAGTIALTIMAIAK